MIAANYQTSRDLAIRKIEAIPVAIPMLRPIKWASGARCATREKLTVKLWVTNGQGGLALTADAELG